MIKRVRSCFGLTEPIGLAWSMKVRDVLWLLRKDGWYHVRTTGSHAHYQHAVKRGTVTVAGSSNRDLAPKTFRSILKQAGLEYPPRLEG